jgi:hypothetical protein
MLVYLCQAFDMKVWITMCLDSVMLPEHFCIKLRCNSFAEFWPLFQFCLLTLLMMMRTPTGEECCPPKRSLAMCIFVKVRHYAL